MKKAFAALTVTAVAATAQAGSLNLDMRFDFTNKTYNKEAATTGDSNFGFQMGRLDYQGQLSEKTSFRTRLRFTSTDTGKSAHDNVGKHVDLAFVSQKLSDSTSLSIGRMTTDIGALEGRTASPDLYLKSAAYGGLSFNNTANARSYSGNYLYASGVKVGHKIGDHELTALIVNPAETDQNPENSRFMVGATARGTYMDKSLGYSLGFHDVALEAKDEKSNFLSGGVFYKMGDVKFSGEYAANTYTDATKNKHVLSSVIGGLTYTGIEGVTPALKVVSNTFKPNAGDKTTSTGLQGVVEFVPVKEEPFRYHLAYSTISEKTGSAAAKTANEMVAGIRINADFLK